MEQQFTYKTILFLTLYGGVTLIAIFDCCYLLLRRNNAFATDIKSPMRLRRWTALFFAAMATSHVWWLFLYPSYPIDPFSPMAILCSALDTITILPITLCTMLAMLQDRRRPLWPVAAVVAISLINLLTISIIGEQASYIFIGFSFLIILLISVTMISAVRQYGRWLRDNYADLENKEVWQNFLVLAVFLGTSITYTIINRDFIWEIVMQVFDLALIFVLLWRVEMLQTLEEPEEEITDEDAPVHIDPIFTKIDSLLQEHCINTQLYLHHDISLSQLAKVIGTNNTYLSRYFAQQSITYNTYINNLRIQYFIHLYQENIANKHFVTARQLAFDSGFKSYSTFSAAFKQIKGQNVTTWMHEQTS